MKILMLNQTIELVGGVEVYLHALVSGLERRGHSVIIAHGFRGFSAGRQGKNFFIDFSRSDDSVCRAIRKLIGQEKPEIIHLHNIAFSGGIRNGIAGFAHSIPIICSIHGHDAYCPSGTKYLYRCRRLCPRSYGLYCLASMLLLRCFESKRPWVSLSFYLRTRRFLRNISLFSKIIVGSQFNKGRLVEHGVEESLVKVVPYFTARPALQEAETNNTILFSGRIYKAKGLDCLLKAASMITVPFNLLIIGEGKEKQACMSLAHRLGLEGKFNFQGWDYLKGDYYRNASVVAVPSMWPEPFGITGIRAMSYAKPVVAFNVGGIPEWLVHGKTGFLIEPYDIKDLAEKIELLLRDKDLARRMGMEGRRKAEECFTQDKHLDSLDKVYEEARSR